MKFRVFISYASEDELSAVEIYDRLHSHGISPWLDVKCLLPGQNWEVEIDKAFADAHLILLLLSPRSIGKRGFVQREANDAMERLRYKLPTDIYVIPVLIEKCDVPKNISSRLQHIDLRIDGAWEQLLTSLRLAAEQQSIELSEGTTHGPFQVFAERLVDKWNGRPGHDISIEYPVFKSTSQPTSSKELSLFFGGRAARIAASLREKSWNQHNDLFDHENHASNNNEQWESFGIAFANTDFLSLNYKVGWYSPGTAHANSYFKTYNFALHNGLQLLTLDDFFVDDMSAFTILSDLIFKGLCKEFFTRTGEEADEMQTQWFKDGIGKELKDLQIFTVGAQGLTFHFAPYEVGSFAMGVWITYVSFYDLRTILKNNGPHLLLI